MARNSEQDGVATDLARQAADKARQAAGWLADRDPGSLLDEVRSFARRKPGTYLAIALGAGVLAGRLTRGLTAPADDDHPGHPGTPAADRSASPGRHRAAHLAGGRTPASGPHRVTTRPGHRPGCPGVRAGRAVSAPAARSATRGVSWRHEQPSRHRDHPPPDRSVTGRWVS